MVQALHDRGRWRMADGREYVGTPADVVREMRSRAFGYTGDATTLVPYCEWVAGRIGARVPASKALDDALAAAWLLSTMVRMRMAVQCTGVVVPLR